MSEATIDALIEWRERIGVRLMYAMTCTHEGDDFGPRAVCVTCFANVQNIGEIVQAEAARAWELGRAAERRDWEFTADLSTPDEDRLTLPNPYRFPPTNHAAKGDVTGTEPEEAV
jgi:hypothetical protein